MPSSCFLDSSIRFLTRFVSGPGESPAAVAGQEFASRLGVPAALEQGSHRLGVGGRADRRRRGDRAAGRPRIGARARQATRPKRANWRATQRVVGSSVTHSIRLAGPRGSPNGSEPLTKAMRLGLSPIHRAVCSARGRHRGIGQRQVEQERAAGQNQHVTPILDVPFDRQCMAVAGEEDMVHFPRRAVDGAGVATSAGSRSSPQTPGQASCRLRGSPTGLSTANQNEASGGFLVGSSSRLAHRLARSRRLSASARNPGSVAGVD